MPLSLRKIFIAFTSASLLCACARGDGTHVSAKQVETLDNDNCIIVDTTLHNLGPVGYADVIAITNWLTNHGTATVRLTDIRTDCACITAEAEQRVIEPGQKVKVNIEFDTRGNTGKQYHLIELKTSNGQTIKIYIVAEISEP
ncbi:MAG: DUF1573 domain-containing protein [Bacteroidales bacterium]|nr:DUF1573 domain-containing protein [Bacteroidales bacterium]